jgi:hypothetical protein
MSSEIARLVSPRIGFACAALVALAACERAAEAPAPRADAANGSVDWARAALQRNPHIEVVASDPEKQVFTIRDRASGEVQVVKLNELAAAPIAQLQGSAAQTATAPEGEPVATEAEPASTAQASEGGPPADEQGAAQAAGIPPQSSSTDAGYTIERTGGQLRVSGPGVSIVSSGPGANAAEASAGARPSEPIICEGRRMVHFDNREIYVDGDAIVVRDGCEIFITNSQIFAKGTGVVARGGVVHISNSHVEGAQASFDVDAKSKLFVRGSTFQGMARRDQLAMVQDQGGNRWR